jgi:hypothetical protein
VGGLAALALVAAPASAHECFNASRSAQANAEIAAHSHGWFDIQTSQISAILVSSCIQSNDAGCPIDTSLLTQGPLNWLTSSDVAYIQSNDITGEILGFAPPSVATQDLLAFTTVMALEAECNGVPSHYLTLANATAAGGAPTKVTTNGTGIDHFPDLYGQQLVDAYTYALAHGAVAC